MFTDKLVYGAAQFNGNIKVSQDIDLRQCFVPNQVEGVSDADKAIQVVLLRESLGRSQGSEALGD